MRTHCLVVAITPSRPITFYSSVLGFNLELVLGLVMVRELRVISILLIFDVFSG